MRMKFIEQLKDCAKTYQLGSYRVWIYPDRPENFCLHRYHAKNKYVPDIIWAYGELKIQQSCYWGAVNMRQAEDIIAGYQEAVEVVKFMGRFLK